MGQLHRHLDITDIFLSDRVVTIGDNASLSGNNITLKAERVSSLVSPLRPLGIGNKDADVIIGNSAIVATGDVSITATARDENINSVVPEFMSSFSHETLNFIFGLAPLPMPVSVMIRDSKSLVSLDSATVTAGGDVKISSDARADATSYALARKQFGSGVVGRTLGTIAVGVSISDASAETLLRGTTSITAAGNINISSNSDSVADVTASANNENNFDKPTTVQGPRLE